MSMVVNPVTRSLNLPPSPVVPSDTVAADEVEAKAVETTKVTAASEPGNSAPHGGTSGQPGLGEHVDVYDTEAEKMAAEKNSQSITQEKVSPPPEKSETVVHKSPLILLGQETDIPKVSQPPPKADFPFLTLLGDSPDDKTPGQVFDTTV